MKYIEGTNRYQLSYLPECLDDYILEENPVRIIEAFVEGLELDRLGFSKTTPNIKGRPPYNPKTLLKLYIYGYMNKIRSTRRLEKQAGINLELMWLLNKLVPDFKTIADFRKDNSKALEGVFKEFVLLCKGWGLFSNELIAVDGTKFKACNNKKRNFTQAKLEKRVTEIENKIAEYLKDLDENDTNEVTDKNYTSEEIQSKIKELQDRKRKYQKYQDQLKKEGNTEISLTDPDARLMINNGKLDVHYNVQVVAEGKNKLIIDCNVTNICSDQGQLGTMAQRGKEILGVAELEVLADKGYYDGADLIECMENRINPYVAKPEHTSSTGNTKYGKDKFKYDKEKDEFICTQGQHLSYRTTGIKSRDGKEEKRYYNRQACLNCQALKECTISKTYRIVTRLAIQDLLDKVDEQTVKYREKYERRKMIVEHPFGTIKRCMDAGYLLTKGKENVKAEVALTFLSYNLKRVMNILGIDELKQRLATT